MGAKFLQSRTFLIDLSFKFSLRGWLKNWFGVNNINFSTSRPNQFPGNWSWNLGLSLYEAN